VEGSAAVTKLALFAQNWLSMALREVQFGLNAASKGRLLVDLRFDSVGNGRFAKV
jgi:hypothetical protein